jgi:hypothetical protein
MKIKTCWLLALLITWPMMSLAAERAADTVFLAHVDKPVTSVYDNVYKSLEDARFFVVFEPNIGANLARFSDKWGDDYNRNKLSEIRSMIFCNGWYANQVSNLDPNMLGFCPLHITLVERDGKTTVLFNRPSSVAYDSPAKDLLLEIETEVIKAIQQGLAKETAH